jgi:hypothetical protein
MFADTLIRDESLKPTSNQHLRAGPINHKWALKHGKLAYTGLTKPAEPKLRLADYINSSKAEIEPPVALAPQPLPPDFHWGMLANETVGNGVVAMMLHSIGIFFIAAGKAPPKFSPADATRIYSHIGGYVPGDPSTDQGLDEGQAFAWWADRGLRCTADRTLHKIRGSVAVNPKNRTERHLGIYELDAIQYAIQLPAMWQGKTMWTGVPGSDPDSQPGSWGGQGIFGRAYDATGREDIGTWGEDLFAAGDSLDAYLMQASVVATPDMLSRTGMSRCGISWDDLWSDLEKYPVNPR